MKILIGPDLHCWPTTYENATKGEIPTRLVEWRNIGQAILDVIKIEKPAAAFFPGDLFDIPTPKASAILEIVNLFTQIHKLGCEVVACMGNHDSLGLEETNFVNIVSRFGKLSWGITKPGFFELPDINICGTVVPYIKPTLLDQTGKLEKVNEKLLELAQLHINWQTSKYKIFMAHWPVKEAIYANGFGPKNEPTYALEDLKKLGYDVCIMGHVHKNQVLSENPLIIHPGVAIRTELNEASVTPSVYLYDLETKELSVRELPARGISCIKFSNKILNFGSGEWENEISDIQDKIVVAKYEAPEDIAQLIDHQVIIDAIYKRGAFYVSGVYPTILRKERNRGAEIDTSLSWADALSVWYDASGEDQGLKDKVINKFKELEKTI